MSADRWRERAEDLGRERSDEQRPIPVQPGGPAAVLALQRTAGNHAVAQLIAANGPAVQPRGVALDKPFDITRHGGGRPLPEPTQERLEGTLGRSLADVRVHEDGQAERLGAHALTEGSHIHFARGRYEPETRAGLGLLAHEAAHVVQQRDGRVPAAGGRALSDPGLEAEAEGVAARAEAGAPASDRAIARSPATPTTGGVVQPALPAAAAGAFFGLSAEAWGVAANIVGLLTVGAGAAAGVATVVARGENAFASYQLPQKVMSDQDREKLQMLAQFRIISQYVQRFLAKNPDIRDEINGQGAGTPAPEEGAAPAPEEGAPAAPEQEEKEADRPTGSPEASAIDEEILTNLKSDVQRELASLLENHIMRSEYEFMWGEGDSRDHGLIGSNGAGEKGGVTGFLQFRNVEGASIVERLELTGLTAKERQAVGPINGDGKLAIVRRFVGGHLSGRATWASTQNLAVNVEGGQAQESVKPGGAPELIVRTSWYWDALGPNSETNMEISITVDDDGIPQFVGKYEGSP